MVDLFHVDLGESYVLQPHRAISDILAEKIPYSLYFGVVSMLISLVLGLLMGMAMAKGKGGLPDALGTGYVVIVRAVPSLIYLFLLQIAITGLFKIPMMFSERNPVTWILPTISFSWKPFRRWTTLLFRCLSFCIQLWACSACSSVIF